jgi:hypothetical protein
MGGVEDWDWKRIGLGVATGGMSEVPHQYSALAGGNDYGTAGKMGGKGAQAPSAPDFSSVAREQAEYSKEAAAEQTRQNRPDQYGPFGSSEWTQGPDGRWTQTSSLAPGLQGAADNLMGQIGAGSSLDPGQARDQAIEAAYRQSTSRLDPRFSSARAAQEAALANEGFSRSDEAWRNAMSEFSRGENDAYQQAMYGAQTGAGNAAFGQSLAANMQPYQQLGALKGLGGNAPFIPAGSADVPQLLAAAMQQYGASMDQYNAGQAGKNSKMQGAATAAPLLVAASDERLKTNIKRHAIEITPGVPFASWEWKAGGRGFGCIAQDLEKVRPDLVVEIDGVKHVNYGGLR